MFKRVWSWILITRYRIEIIQNAQEIDDVFVILQTNSVTCNLVCLKYCHCTCQGKLAQNTSSEFVKCLWKTLELNNFHSTTTKKARRTSKFSPWNPPNGFVLTLKTMLVWLGVLFSKRLTWQSTEWVFSVICRKWCGSQFLYCKTGARGHCYTFAVVYGGVAHGAGYTQTTRSDHLSIVCHYRDLHHGAAVSFPPRSEGTCISALGMELLQRQRLGFGVSQGVDGD